LLVKDDRLQNKRKKNELFGSFVCFLLLRVAAAEEEERNP